VTTEIIKEDRMSLWIVRAGRRGEQEQEVLEHDIVAIGWRKLPDLTTIKTRARLRSLYEKTFPDERAGSVASRVGQIWAFFHQIKIGDLVVLPQKLQSAIAIGRITGEYQYRTDLSANTRHTRPVEWIRTDLPRSEFDQDLLYSLGAGGTVRQSRAERAEERVQAVLEGKRTPDIEDELDIEQVARDQVLTFINRQFKGHHLSRLVEAVLQAEGYSTKISEPGPDGGVDILAGAGPMGFGNPRLSVQVKSSSSPVDVNVFRNLQGTLQTFRANQGLLVSWGGFKKSVLKEARTSFFSIRLWDAGDLLEAILKNYERIPADLQAELPLKRIWALVLEEE